MRRSRGRLCGATVDGGADVPGGLPALRFLPASKMELASETELASACVAPPPSVQAARDASSIGRENLAADIVDP